MNKKTCGIFGCNPMCFPWGYDEDDDCCITLKLLLLNKITVLRANGVCNFAVAMDSGIGLYATEIINSLRENDPEIQISCVVPYEEQATKWTPGLRERYFNELSKCSEVEIISTAKTADCEIAATLNVIDRAEFVIAVASPEDSKITVALHYASRIKRQVINIELKQEDRI
jgi:uncharacterized phage-like protein YoqJ